LDEVKLIQKIQEGDMEKFEELFERYKHQAIRTAYLVTGNRHTSEDIVQEAFVRCYLSIKELRKPEQFKVWFLKMLTRIAWRAINKEKRLVPIENIFEASQRKDSESALKDFQDEKQTQDLYDEISKLDSKHRMVLILYYYNDMSVREIAKVMNCLDGTVKSRLHTARKKLRANLGGLNTNDVYLEKGSELYGSYKSI
jgi:RNA polymerase sigma-70 factor (ECF subfamily)